MLHFCTKTLEFWMPWQIRVADIAARGNDFQASGGETSEQKKEEEEKKNTTILVLLHITQYTSCKDASNAFSLQRRGHFGVVQIQHSWFYLCIIDERCHSFLSSGMQQEALVLCIVLECERVWSCGRLSHAWQTLERVKSNLHSFFFQLYATRCASRYRNGQHQWPHAGIIMAFN